MYTHIILAMFKTKHIMFPSQNRFKGNCCARKVPWGQSGVSPRINWTKQSFCYLPGPMPLGSKFTILPCYVSLEIQSEKHIYIYIIYIYIQYIHVIYIYIYIYLFTIIYIYTHNIYIYTSYVYIYIYIHTHKRYIYICVCAPWIQTLSEKVPDTP